MIFWKYFAVLKLCWANRSKVISQWKLITDIKVDFFRLFFPLRFSRLVRIALKIYGWRYPAFKSPWKIPRLFTFSKTFRSISLFLFILYFSWSSFRLNTKRTDIFNNRNYQQSQSLVGQTRVCVSCAGHTNEYSHWSKWKSNGREKNSIFWYRYLIAIINIRRTKDGIVSTYT